LFINYLYVAVWEGALLEEIDKFCVVLVKKSEFLLAIAISGKLNPEVPVGFMQFEKANHCRLVVLC